LLSGTPDFEALGPTISSLSARPVDKEFVKLKKTKQKDLSLSILSCNDNMNLLMCISPHVTKPMLTS
jgi:hypothetical protein